MYEFMIFLSIVIWLAAGFYYLRHPACAIYHPVTVFLAFHVIVFVFRPIVSVIYDFDLIYKAVGFNPSVWDRVTVLLAANLALVVFISVCLKFGNAPIAWRQSENEKSRRDEWKKYFWIVAIPLASAAVYSSLWQWQFESSSGDMTMMDMRTGVRTMQGVSGYFLVLGSMLGTLTVICAYLYRFSLVSLIPFVVFAVLRLGTGGRSDFIAATMMLLVVFLFDQRRKWPEPRTLAIGLVAIFAFNTVVQDRGASIRELFGLSGTNENRVWSEAVYKKFEQNDTAMLEAFEFIVYAVPQRTGSYDYFANNLRVLVEPIPRSWWADKPAGSPVNFFYLYDYGNPIGMAISMPGAGWLSLGYFGVIIWSALFGWAYGTAYSRFATGQQGNLAVMIYGVVYSTALFAFRDGMLIMVIKLLFTFSLPLLILVPLVKIMNPSLLRVSDAGTAQPGIPEVALREEASLRAHRNGRKASLPLTRAHRPIGLVPRAWRS